MGGDPEMNVVIRRVVAASVSVWFHGSVKHHRRGSSSHLRQISKSTITNDVYNQQITIPQKFWWTQYPSRAITLTQNTDTWLVSSLKCDNITTPLSRKKSGIGMPASEAIFFIPKNKRSIPRPRTACNRMGTEIMSGYIFPFWRRKRDKPCRPVIAILSQKKLIFQRTHQLRRIFVDVNGPSQSFDFFSLVSFIV